MKGRVLSIITAVLFGVTVAACPLVMAAEPETAAPATHAPAKAPEKAPAKAKPAKKKKKVKKHVKHYKHYKHHVKKRAKKKIHKKKKATAPAETK